jgi:hypothetical protein
LSIRNDKIIPATIYFIFVIATGAACRRPSPTGQDEWLPVLQSRRKARLNAAWCVSAQSNWLAIRETRRQQFHARRVVGPLAEQI